MASKKVRKTRQPRPGMRHVHFHMPACPPDDPALRAFVETAMQIFGYWPFTILETTEYTDPQTGQPMIDALLEVPPHPGVPAMPGTGGDRP